MQALWMVLASFLFATLAVGVKVASGSFNTFELLLYRGLVSVVFIAAVLRHRGTSVRSPVPMMHAWRGLIGVLALGCWFYAIAHLPLATALTLNYMSGVWVAAFVVGGAVLYGNTERQGPLMATVLAGFGGVVLMLRPTIDQNQLFAGLVGLLSGLSAALAYLQVAALGKMGEPEGRTVFYFALSTLVVGIVGVGFVGFSPWSGISWQALAWLVPIGVLAALGQWAMTHAYNGGSTLLAANMQYSGIVFAVVYGLVLFGEQISWMGWSGMGVIIASGLAATVLRRRAMMDTLAAKTRVSNPAP